MVQTVFLSALQGTNEIEITVTGRTSGQPVLDPTHSGRVTMDYLMKGVPTALEWSYEAKAPDVKGETLEKAAQLLVLRRDTLRIIDGAGPGIESPQAESAKQGNGSGTESERETGPTNQERNATETGGMVGQQVQTCHPAKCTFAEVVSIDLQRFLDSGIALVECPTCASTRSLSPRRGVLHFPNATHQLSDSSTMDKT